MSDTDTVNRVGVVGARLMRSSIAESAGRASIPVVLHEPEDVPFRGSRDRVEASVARAGVGGKATDEGATAIFDRITWTTDRDGLTATDLVIEAIVEDPGIKGRLLRGLDAQLHEPCLLASNTSSIPIAQLASCTRRSERVLGVHFFSPVPIMRLVEIAVALDTSDEPVAAAEAFAQAIGKTSTRTKERSGFIVNMVLIPYLMAGVRMYEYEPARERAVA
jgi:3-hydroxybutyryl-CoA dehydrogenase